MENFVWVVLVLSMQLGTMLNFQHSIGIFSFCTSCLEEEVYYGSTTFALAMFSCIENSLKYLLAMLT